MINQFAQDVEKGLSAERKSLSSKYFYDEIGDQIFVKIMGMPEYYLTKCEFEILSTQAKEIREAFKIEGKEFEIIELGAGDGTKTIELLKVFKSDNFFYKPIDISKYAIQNLKNRLEKELPWLKFEGMQGEYFKVLSSLKSSKPKVVLFLGSNIGNLLDDQSREFINKLSKNLNQGDKVLIGVDLKKKSEIVLPAYNDAQGFSKDFNLNLLNRINRELGADFVLEQFSHQPHYDEEKGIAYSYLISLCDQKVHIKQLGKDYFFKKNEKIHTEISRKYDTEIMQTIIKESNLEIQTIFTDKKNYFSNYLLNKR